MTGVAHSAAIGVVVVTFNAADVIEECLTSLVALEGTETVIAVADNASSDDTVAVVRAWAAAHPGLRFAEVGAADPVPAAARVLLIHTGANRGFAGGVNVGLAVLAQRPEVGHFWVLNPDAFASPTAGQAILRAAGANPGYGMMGGRVQYAEPPHLIQIDGGTINRWTGVTSNINLWVPVSDAQMPDASQVDFVTGANLVVSRRFYETVGPMEESYFLYYEEVDWALRRGSLPLIIAPDLVVYHHAGTAIGSPTVERIATPFSFWFKYRSRMMFVRRFFPVAWPVAMAYATAKALQLLLKGARPQALSLLGAIYGLPAPRAVRDKLSPEAQRIAFGKVRR